MSKPRDKPEEFARFESLASRLLKAPKINTVTEHMKVSPLSVEQVSLVEPKAKRKRERKGKNQ
ncbi:MAG: hypothetical protein KIT83_07430 [Bryobacterales bacterium]|nr:hypothetical protein [Bryobacterales bacterium]